MYIQASSILLSYPGIFLFTKIHLYLNNSLLKYELIQQLYDVKLCSYLERNHGNHTALGIFRTITAQVLVA